jgi:inhibitor of cysteine peptidase
MSTKFTLIPALLLVLAMAGCSLVPSGSPSTGPTESSGSASNKQLLPIVSGKQVKLSLDAAADGSTQQMAVGEIMAITLESNPSTGFGWFATSSDNEVISQRGEAQNNDPTSSETPVVGAPGTQTIYFEAKAKGTATLTLDYKRGWETDVQPEKTVTLTVEVK